jgi:hypothetical protein
LEAKSFLSRLAHPGCHLIKKEIISSTKVAY